jgi:PAS domain S-box-containing protein
MITRLAALSNQNLVKVVGVIIAISLILFGIILTFTWLMYSNFNQLIDNQFALGRISDEVVYLDEVLTMSARMAALTGDLAWETRYNENVVPLDSAVKQLHELAPESYQASIKNTDIANIALVEMEVHAFDLARQGDLKGAQEILFGQAYQDQKKIYSDGIQDVLRRSRQDADTSFRRFQSQLLSSGLAGLIIMPLLILSWATMFVQIRHYLKARQKAEDDLRESAEKIRTVFEAVSDGIEIMDLRGTLVDINDAVLTLHRYTSKAVLIGHDSLDLVADNNQNKIKQLVEDIANSDRKLETEILLKRQDGSLFDGQISLAPLKDKGGNRIGSVASVRDITARKAAERERERLIKELESAVLFKDQFLATMSHELRTPMNAVLGYTGLILQEDGLDEDVVNMLNRIRNNSNRLLNLINDILDISRINAERVEIVSRPVDLHTLARNWYKDFQTIADNRGLDFEFSIDPMLPETIVGDEERLTQITANLLQNAFKFTEKGKVELRVEQRGGQWAVVVSDTGLGIPDTWQHLIFDEFRQVDSSSKRKYGGAGLGLSIVRKLCLLMGGTVTVNSKLGAGSTFTILLPLPVPQLQPQLA